MRIITAAILLALLPLSASANALSPRPLIGCTAVYMLGIRSITEDKDEIIVGMNMQDFIQLSSQANRYTGFLFPEVAPKLPALQEEFRSRMNVTLREEGADLFFGKYIPHCSKIMTLARTQIPDFLH